MVAAKHRIQGIYDVPATYEEMRHNVDLILQFMTRSRIKMHRISSRGDHWACQLWCHASGFWAGLQVDMEGSALEWCIVTI